MRKSKYDPLDVTNRLHELNIDKYAQLNYGNLEDNDDPFKLRSFNSDNLFGNKTGNAFNGHKLNYSNYGSTKSEKIGESNKRFYDTDPLDIVSKMSNLGIKPSDIVPKYDPLGIVPKISNLGIKPSDIVPKYDPFGIGSDLLSLRNPRDVPEQISNPNQNPNTNPTVSPVEQMNQLLRLQEALKGMGMRPNILEVPTVKQLLGIKMEKKEKELSETDIAILDKFKNLLHSVLSCNNEALDINHAVTTAKHYYTNGDFVNLIDNIIRNCEAFNKQTNDITKEYNLLIKSINEEKKIDSNKIHKTEEKMMLLLTDYDKIKNSYSQVFNMLNTKFEAIKREVAAYNDAYRTTIEGIQVLISDISGGGGGGDVTILQNRKKFQQDNGHTYNYAKISGDMETSITADTLHFNTKMLSQMAIAVNQKEKPDFVSDKRAEMDRIIKVLLDDSEGNFKAQKILDRVVNIEDIIKRSLEDREPKKIFKIGNFNAGDPSSLLRTLGLPDDVADQVNESLGNIEKLIDVGNMYVNDEYPNINTFLGTVIDHNTVYDDNNDAGVVKLLSMMTYTGNLGEMMVVSTYIMIVTFFICFYLKSPFEFDVGGGPNINLRDTKLEVIVDGVLNGINTHDYAGLKTDPNFKDHPVSDIIMMVLFLKLKLMLHYRGAFNELNNLFYVRDRDLTDNVYNVYIDIQNLVHNEIGDFEVLLHNNARLNITGANGPIEFIESVQAHRILLQGFKALDVSKNGCKDRALEQSQDRGNNTLLSCAIEETFDGIPTTGNRNSDGIYHHMVNLGLGNIFKNDAVDCKGINKFNMILKSCDRNDFLISAGNLNRAGYAQSLFNTSLNDVILSAPNDNFADFGAGKSEQDRQNYIVDIIKEVHKSIEDINDLNNDVIALLNEDHDCGYRDIICCKEIGDIASEVTQAILLAIDHTSVAVAPKKAADVGAADAAAVAMNSAVTNFNTNKENINNAVHRIIIDAVIRVLNDHNENITTAAENLLNDLTEAGVESIVMAVTTTRVVSKNLGLTDDYIRAALAISAATAINHVAWRMANNAYQVLNAVANGIDKFADEIHNVSGAAKPNYANALMAANVNTLAAINALKALIDNPTAAMVGHVVAAVDAPAAAAEVAGANGFNITVDAVFNTLNTGLSELVDVKTSLDAINNDIAITSHGNINATLTNIAADPNIQSQINNAIGRVAGIVTGTTENAIITAANDVNIIANTVGNVNAYTGGAKNALYIATEFATNIATEVINNNQNGTATANDLQDAIIRILASAIAASIVIVPSIAALAPPLITAKNILDISNTVLNEVLSNPPNDLFTIAQNAIIYTVGRVGDFQTNTVLALRTAEFNNQSLALKAIAACLACKNDSIDQDTLKYNYMSIAVEAAISTTKAVYGEYITQNVPIAPSVALPDADLERQVMSIFMRYFDMFALSKVNNIAEEVAGYMANGVYILPLLMGNLPVPNDVKIVTDYAKARAFTDKVTISATCNVVDAVYNAMVNGKTKVNTLADALNDLTTDGFVPVICSIIATMAASKHLGFGTNAVNSIYTAVADAAIRAVKTALNAGHNKFDAALTAAKDTIWNEYQHICPVHNNNVIEQAYTDDLVEHMFKLALNATTDKKPIAYNVLTKAITENKLGDVMIFFIYNMIIHLVMFYYCMNDISYDLDHMNDDGDFVGLNGNNHNIKSVNTYSRYQTNGANTPIFQTIIRDFYMLLGRFIAKRGEINGTGINLKQNANRQAFITGIGHANFANFTEDILGNNRNISMRSIFTCNVPNDIYQYSCADSKFTMIVDYLAKLCIVPNPVLNGGPIDSKITVSMNEFRTACAQTGALLYGFWHEPNIP